MARKNTGRIQTKYIEAGVNGGMELKIVEENGVVTFFAKGQLDTTTFSDFEEALKPYLTDHVKLVLDFEDLEYLSSAGLRVILRSQQRIEELNNASMVIRNCNEEVMEVFEITGFADFLTFE